ncbi:MAG TPA: DUF1254 domain-containing protein [Beijerinckiaceae bacterium]|nr:DUF1254 domain-containing protein [Beijerinckiaceae bacterium]
MKNVASLARSALGWGPYLAATLMVAGMVHIVSVLAMPRLAPRDAFARISALAPLDRTTLLAPVSPKNVTLPFEDPATALGVCRYDLREGPLRLTAALEPGQLILFSFHARFGQVFYSMTDRVASHGGLDVLVLTLDQLQAYEANDTGDELPKQLRIVSPSMRGFVLLRALAVQPGDMPQARASISAVDCTKTQAPQS